MRIAALIVGIFGAMAGFIGALVALAVGGIGGAIEVEGAETVIIGGWIALLMSVVALVGAALSMAKPRVAAGLMAVSAIVGVIAVFAAYVLATILLTVAAIFAFLGRQRVERLGTQAMSARPGHYCGSCGQPLEIEAKFCRACGMAQA